MNNVGFVVLGHRRSMAGALLLVEGFPIDGRDHRLAIAGVRTGVHQSPEYAPHRTRRLAGSTGAFLLAAGDATTTTTTRR